MTFEYLVSLAGSATPPRFIVDCAKNFCVSVLVECAKRIYYDLYAKIAFDINHKSAAFQI